MIVNPLPPFEYLPAADIEKIHTLSLKLLAELGLEFNHPEAIAIWEAAGAEILDRETGHVRLPSQLVLVYKDASSRRPDAFRGALKVGRIGEI